MQRPTDTLSLLKDIANGVFAKISYQSREVEGTQGRSPLDERSQEGGARWLANREVLELGKVHDHGRFRDRAELR